MTVKEAIGEMRQGRAVCRPCWDREPEPFGRGLHLYLGKDDNGEEALLECYGFGSGKKKLFGTLDQEDAHADDWEVYQPGPKCRGENGGCTACKCEPL